MPVTPQKVIIHPLVLLSVVDHFNRNREHDREKRVVGALLGSTYKDGTIAVFNAYAVPFDEDEKEPNVWFLDHNYHERMYDMHQKVSSKEKVVGWYSTGPKLRPNDLAIHSIFRRYTPDPVLLVIEVKPREIGIPCDAYFATEEVEDESSEPKMTFKHIPSEVGSLEAEEIGVEHLLRDVKDTSGHSISTLVAEKVNALHGLQSRLETVQTYLKRVLAGELSPSHPISYLLQNALNLLPHVSHDSMAKSFATQTNDTMLVLYLSSLFRSVMALHDLISNKLSAKEQEKTKPEEGVKPVPPPRPAPAEKNEKNEKKGDSLPPTEPSESKGKEDDSS
eukprot:TRINITY_DN705_c0_g1_i2.p1 TRINITY_DN705_c0_g1~~TRINITY_DN705_c0_g1_i2.p1  ORF type:complete len:335 (-),score=100.90 TRINITY_DN705_c0_g1_i2:223-1227(-)